ncbi:MAG TPA: efflux RND transporter periplasmic adaptor subunit [Anaerolineae bacterium]
MKLNRRVLIGIGIIVVLLVIAATVFVMAQPKVSPPNIAVVRRGDLTASVNATGKVQAKKSARLALPLSGSVANIFKREGDDVKMGDVILSLGADDATRRVKQADLNLQSRQLDLARAKAAPRDEDITIARANVQKATITVAAAEAAYTASPNAQNDAVRQAARADLDIARASFNRVTNGPTQAEIDALQNTVTSAQIDLDSAKQSLSQTQLTAPFTSTVVEINVRVGELVGGFNPLATVADLTALEIAADIDEIDVANVQVGQSVQVRFDAFPGETFSGKLTRLFPAASTLRGTTTYAAVVDFDAKDSKVRPGMGANLKIQTVEKPGVLLVPNRALKNVGARKAVRVVAPGEPRDVIVETGATDGNETEIVSGVNEGDQVQLN